MWRSCNELSQADKEKQAKDAERINKAWNESKERERKEKIANSFGFEKNNKHSTSKGPKM